MRLAAVASRASMRAQTSGGECTAEFRGLPSPPPPWPSPPPSPRWGRWYRVVDEEEEDTVGGGVVGLAKPSQEDLLSVRVEQDDAGEGEGEPDEPGGVRCRPGRLSLAPPLSCSSADEGEADSARSRALPRRCRQNSRGCTPCPVKPQSTTAGGPRQARL